MHHYRQALVRMRAGDSDRQIAQQQLLGRHKAAEFRALAQREGWLQSTSAMPRDEVIGRALEQQPPPQPKSVSSVEAWREQIATWVSSGVQATAIHAALKREYGFGGHYSSVRRMVEQVRQLQPVATTVRLDFEPGCAAQVDFGAGPMLLHPDGQMRRTWAFVMTLCHSRHQYVEFVWNQTVATWLGCHRRAFEWFAGVPERIIIDNAKCAITKACVHDPQAQRSYAECAEGYGFRIDPCPPHDPQKKGIVESGVKYVKGNFVPLRTFRDLADLNAQVRAWVMNEAGLRRHGTTRVAPLELFALERAHLQSLPEQAPDLGTWSRVSVHRDCHIKFDHCLYSAPFSLVGQTVWLRSTDTIVALFHEHRLVASHVRSLRPGQRMTVRDHLPPKAQLFFAHDRQWLAQQAQAIGPACTQLLQRLLGDRIVERLRAAQGVIQLAKPYGTTRLEAACARALAHDSPHYRTVKSILKSGADRQPAQDAATEQVYAPQRFVRPAASLFAPLPQTTPSHLH